MTAATTPVERWRLGYRPGLDGVRGVAIAIVLLAHGGFIPSWIGPTGVTVFFVLSGFLITRLLLLERQRAGAVSIRGFYLRRARRLLPALVVMLAIVVALRPSAWTDALWALTYVSNWAILAGVEMPLFEHTWSLAIEEQFYLLWPLAFVLLGRRAVPVVVVATVVLLAARALPMGSQQLAYSTMTQAPSLLIGVLLAFVSWQRVRWPIAWAVAGALGIAVSLTLPHAARDPVAALATVPLIVAGYQGVFGWRPLAGLGRISYGVYLWQSPVLLLTGASLGARGLGASAAAIALAVAIAAVSWFVVERPILRGVGLVREADHDDIAGSPCPRRGVSHG